MRQLSAQGLQQILSANVSDLFLPLLEVDDNYLVSDTVSLSFEGKEYTPFPFEMRLPVDKEGEVPVIELTVDNVDRRLVALLRSISEPPDCRVCIVRKRGSEIVQEIDWMTFSMNNISYNVNEITATLSYKVDYLNEPASKDYFNYNTAPGLYG